MLVRRVRVSEGLGAVEEVMVDIGPELFDDEGGGIDTDVEAPLASGVTEGALGGGIVQIGDAGGGSGAEDFADVEDFFAGVGTCDDGATEGIAAALEEAAVAEGVVAVVLVGDGGDDGFDEEVFAGLVYDRVPEIAAVGDASAAEFGICVLVEAPASKG